MSERNGSLVRAGARWFRYATLWIGLALCVVAAWKLTPDLSGVLNRVDGGILAGWLVILLLIWVLTVAAWRCSVAGFLGRPLSWRAAFRQTGLLLAGKYVPGGVFGFLARASDGDNPGSRQRYVAAGLYEQVNAIAIIAATGLVFLAASRWGLAWFIALLLVPAVFLTLAKLGTGVAAFLLPPRLLKAAEGCLVNDLDWSQLLLSLCLMQLSVVGWMLLATWVAVVAFLQPVGNGVGLAGAFGISIVAGIVVAFAPGGIGVRESALASIGSHWLPLPEAIAFAAVLRLLATLLDCCAGAAAFFLTSDGSTE